MQSSALKRVLFPKPTGYWQLLLWEGQENKELIGKRIKSPKGSGFLLCSPPEARGVRANDSILGNTSFPPLSSNSLASAQLPLQRGDEASLFFFFWGPGLHKARSPPKLSCPPDAPDTASTPNVPKARLGSGPQGSARVQISAATGSKGKQKDYICKDYIPSQLQPPQTSNPGTGGEPNVS